MKDLDALSEALRILVDRHRDELEGIYRRKVREIKKCGGILQ